MASKSIASPGLFLAMIVLVLAPVQGSNQPSSCLAPSPPPAPTVPPTSPPTPTPTVPPTQPPAPTVPPTPPPTPPPTVPPTQPPAPTVPPTPPPTPPPIVPPTQPPTPTVPSTPPPAPTIPPTSPPTPAPTVSPPPPPPPPKGGQCPTNILVDLTVCVNLDLIGNPGMAMQPCCRPIAGLSSTDAAKCLCTALKINAAANVKLLFIINTVLKLCGKANIPALPPLC